MTTLQSSGLEPAVRLKSLKNAKRRVMPGEEEIQNLDQFNPDIAGTANPTLAPAPTQNTPQPAIGSQVSAQSYDPRANQVMTAPPVPVGPPQPVMANPNPPPSQENLGTPPPAEQQPSLMNRLGESLRSEWKQRPGAFSYMPESIAHPAAPEVQPQSQPAPTPEAEEQAPYGPQLPPYPLLGSGLKGIWEDVKQKQKEPMIGQETVEKGYKSAIPDFSFEQSRAFDKEVEKRSQEYGRRFPGWGPQKPPEAEPAAGLEQPLSPKEHPEVKGYFSPVDEVADSPEHQEVFEKKTGLPFTPEIRQHAEIGHEAKEYLDNGEVDDSGLSDQAKRLVDRIKSNQATDADMYMIGLAVLMPLVVGGMFGKEAGFGALAGEMKGVGDVYEGRKKDTQEAEKLLAEIDKTKATQQLAVAKGDIGGSYSDAEWVDEKGQKIPVKEIGHGIYIDPKFLRSKAQEASAIKQKDDVLNQINASRPLIDAAKTILAATEQLDDPSFWKQMNQWAAYKFDPQFATKFAQEVIIDGKTVNAASAIQNAIAKANVHFARQNKLGQPDAAEQTLFGRMLRDPTESFTSPEQTAYQAGGFLEDTLNSINERVSNYGIHLDPNIFDFERQSKEISKKKQIESESIESESLRSGSVERGE